MSFGEILDYLIYDSRTHYILMYVEGIRHARLQAPCARRHGSTDHPAQGRPARGGRTRRGYSGMSAVSDTVFDAPSAAPASSASRTSTNCSMPLGALAPNSGRKATAWPSSPTVAAWRHGRRPCRRSDIPLAALSRNHRQPEQGAASPLVAQQPIDIGGDATPERYRDALLAISQDPNVTAPRLCCHRKP